MPLTYQFGYWSPLSQMLMIIRSELELSSTLLILPAGSSSNNYTIALAADVFDSLSARSQAIRNVVVTELPMMTNLQLNSYLEKLLSSLMVRASSDTDPDDAIDVNAVKQSVAISAYLLNRIDSELHESSSRFLFDHSKYL